MEATVFPKLDYTYSGRHRMKRDRGATHSKWTQEERQALNRIYFEMCPPARHAPKEVWDLYLHSFAGRFLGQHPHRSKEEVTEKIRVMIQTRQFKEAGEVQYWEGIRESKG